MPHTSPWDNAIIVERVTVANYQLEQHGHLWCIVIDTIHSIWSA